ncbi:unnamed protein product [Tenebrio molitor]|nr:unnamed protein product [Tenebrio molitor]
MDRLWRLLHLLEIFINRKNFHSLNVLLVCDSDLKILSVNARYPGSVHDSAVYMMND